MAWRKKAVFPKNYRFFSIFLENHAFSDATILYQNDRLIKRNNNAEFQKKILTVPTLAIASDDAVGVVPDETRGGAQVDDRRR